MEKEADAEKLDAFWELYPELEQYVSLFLIDYYKIFPHLKPADEGDKAEGDEKDNEGDKKDEDGPKDDSKPQETEG